MITTIEAAARHFADHGWLKTFWLFSFDDYYDPNNVNFSSLRVFNDDTIAPHSGFPLHGHREMEIVTIMLAGELTHEDSLGNRAVIRRGDIQRMTAGRGIRHSEFNHGSEDVKLYQLWIEPRTKGLAPGFAEHNFLAAPSAGGLEPLASGEAGVTAPLSINADVTIYRASFVGGERIERRTSGRSIFLYVTEGSVRINGAPCGPGDQARVVGEDLVVIESPGQASGVLVDLP